MSCPVCGMVNRPDAQVCRGCGLPVAGSGDPLRGVGQGWFVIRDTGFSTMGSVVGLALVLALVLVGGTLAVSGGGILQHGGRLVVVPDVRPTPGADVTPAPSRTSPAIVSAVAPPSTEPAEATSSQASGYTCDNAEIRDATRSRWRLRAVRAGARRSFERVTLELARGGNVKRKARISMEWMSPSEARRVFGLPRFQGQRGLLLTFSGQVTSTGAQLIGGPDLASEGMDSIGGIYRFVDFDGVARTYVALRDGACARLRAPQLQSEGRGPRNATILLDFRG